MQVSKEVLRALCEVADKKDGSRYNSVLALDGEVVALDGFALVCVGGPKPSAAESAVVPLDVVKSSAACLKSRESVIVAADGLRATNGATFAFPPRELPVARESLAKICAPEGGEAFVGRFAVPLLARLLKALEKLDVKSVEVYAPRDKTMPYTLRGETSETSAERRMEDVYVLVMPYGEGEAELAGRRPRFATEERPAATEPASEPEAEPEAAPAE